MERIIHRLGGWVDSLGSNPAKKSAKLLELKAFLEHFFPEAKRSQPVAAWQLP